MFWIFLASWALLADEFDTSRKAYLLEGEGVARLAFSSCWVEEAGECIEYEISCEQDDYRLRLTVHDEALDFARSAIEKAGSRKLAGELSLNQHQTIVKLQISQVDFWYSDMDEFWGATFYIDHGADIFDALTVRSSLRAVIRIEDRPFWLHLVHQQQPNLLDFKQKCIEISRHLVP